MQTISSNKPRCCAHCGKSYVLKTNLDKHMVLCDMLQQSKQKKRKKSDDGDAEDDVDPSTKKLYRILLEFGERFHRLEERVEELSKFVVKKKKQINARQDKTR